MLPLQSTFPVFQAFRSPWESLGWVSKLKENLFFPLIPGREPAPIPARILESRFCPGNQGKKNGILLFSSESMEIYWNLSPCIPQGFIKFPGERRKKEAKPNSRSPRGNYSLNIQVHPNSRGCSLVLPFPPPKTSRISAKTLSNIPKAPQLRFRWKKPDPEGFSRRGPGIGSGLVKGKSGNGRERETEPGNRIRSLGIRRIQAELPLPKYPNPCQE